MRMNGRRSAATSGRPRAGASAGSMFSARPAGGRTGRAGPPPIGAASPRRRNRRGARPGSGAIVAAVMSFLLLAAARAQDWPAYGGDAGGSRFSGAAQITRANVAGLAVAWTYHTGEPARRGPAFKRSA